MSCGSEKGLNISCDKVLFVCRKFLLKKPNVRTATWLPDFYSCSGLYVKFPWYSYFKYYSDGPVTLVWHMLGLILGK